MAASRRLIRNSPGNRTLAAAVAALLGLSLTACGLLASDNSGTVSVAPPTAAVTQIPVSPSPSDGASRQDARWRFFVVRHADRADDGTDDPPLTAAGEARAGRLADLLPRPGAAVYATPFRRTQSTAQPTALAWGVPITTYDANTGATDLVMSIQRQHPSGAILIVGHSDTVPDIVSELCQCTVGPIDESDFGNLFEVDLAADGGILKAEQSADY